MNAMNRIDPFWNHSKLHEASDVWRARWNESESLAMVTIVSRVRRVTLVSRAPQVKDPQQSLLAALGSLSVTPKRKSGPCDKCDKPDHHADDCPFYPKPRDNHR
eukprot:606791-Prorocentrum_minimum.AAC.3